MDRSKKGKLTLDDLKFAMKKRNLPQSYAKSFMEKAKGPKIFARTITWGDFQSVMHERESTMLRTFNSMSASRNGLLKTSDVKQVLEGLGWPPRTKTHEQWCGICEEVRSIHDRAT